MKILVFGKTGQVARELQELARSSGHEFIFADRAEADFSRPDTCLVQIERHSPDAVINAAAYTAVDKSEEDADTAWQVNAKTVSDIAELCAKRLIRLVHISTDYVFDGSGDAPRAPSAPTAPINTYGASKHAGEVAIRAAQGPHAILRTSWIFSSHGSNFVKTMLRLSESRDALSVVSDQIGGPTPASAIASTCVTLAEGETCGTYHFSGAPDVSWADFARAIFAVAGRDVAVSDIPTADYPTPAKRPLNSRLDCASLKSDFGVKRPEWKDALKTIIEELT